jgi:sulfite exporter TauE/SafE
VRFGSIGRVPDGWNGGEEIAEYLLIFLAGFAGSFHCIGMCGGFACALGTGQAERLSAIERQLLYNLGRLTTYAFIGVLAGSMGQVLCTSTGVTNTVLDGSLSTSQRLLAVASGVLMLLMALQFFGLPRLHRVAVGLGGDALASSFRTLLAAPGLAAPLAFGVFNGFLPCPLVYAFAAQAAASAHGLSGMLTMVAFGAGTFPAMLMMGGVGRAIGPAWRRRGVRLAGGFILVLGLITLGRGLLPLVGHGHASL